MQLPFSHDQFLDLFADYNRALWPALLALWLLTALLLVRLFFSVADSSQLVAGLLALHWAWSGAVYHLGWFRRINPAATLFGIVFLLEAGLLMWRGVGTARLRFDAGRSKWRPLAIGLIVYAMLYPAIGIASGLNVPRWPSFGVPCPTAVLTAGLLLLTPRAEARILGVIPLLWTAVGGSAALLLEIRADLTLIVGGVALSAYLATGFGRRHLKRGKT